MQRRISSVFLEKILLLQKIDLLQIKGPRAVAKQTNQIGGFFTLHTTLREIEKHSPNIRECQYLERFILYPQTNFIFCLLQPKTHLHIESSNTYFPAAN